MTEASSMKSMELPVVLVRLAEWFLYQFLANSCYRAAMKVKNHGVFIPKNNPSSIIRSSSISSSPHHQFSLYPNVTKCNLHGRRSQTLVCDVEGCLLRSNSFFPYFMLVAFEGGSILRALILLLSSPILSVLDYEMRMRVMIFLTFCGLRSKDMETVSRAVLPKFYLENLNLHAYEALSSAGSKAVFTAAPRVMVEGFLKEYLSVDSVKGTELHTVGNVFTGLVSSSGLLVKHRALKECFGEKRPDIGIGPSNPHHHLFLSHCKVCNHVPAL